MASKSKLISLLTRDHLQLAERYLREGKKDKAAEAYARGGDFPAAARLAAELGDEPRAVEYSLRGALGEIPEGYAEVDARQAGELLAVKGQHKEAIFLFELAKAFRQAAEAALKVHQPARAARFYERGKAWAEAALYYRRAGMLEDAARVLELEAKRLRQEPRTRGDQTAEMRLREVDLERVDILAKLGKGAEGTALLRQTAPTPQTARLLDEAGKYREAVETYLQLGEIDKAAAILRKAPDLDRRLAAEVYLRSGQAVEAGHVLAALGLPREAAEAYEAGKDWAKAGSRWEAAADPERAAVAYLRAGRPRDAARSFAAAGKPQLAAAAFAKAGDHAAAADCYLKAGQPIDAAGELLAVGKRPEAAKALMEIEPGRPDFADGTLLLAPLLVEEGLLDEALRRLRLVPRHALDDTAAGAASAQTSERLYWEGRALEGLGKRREAEACYQRLVAAKGGHRDAAARLADLQETRERGSVAAVAAAAAAVAAAAVTGRVGPLGAAGAAAAADAARAAATGERRGEQVLPETALAGPRSGWAAALGGDAAVGQLFAGRYDILSELGRGGMGRVYKAHDRELGELVAIKTLLGGPAGGPAGGAGSLSAAELDGERLLREVQICRRITHPNVVRVFDLGRFAGGIFITMELLEGQRLDTLIDPGRPLSAARLRSILGEIAAGLKEAHSLGVIHRDLKPGNIMITPARLKILDFGIASMAGFDRRLTQTGFAVGSPFYMSPEQLQGDALDGRSDLYSLGVLAFTLLAGREPFDGPTAAAIAIQHLQQRPPDLRQLRPDLPAGWPDLVEKLLAKKPAERYQSAQELIDALATLPE